jgi:hypothetical protein
MAEEGSNDDDDEDNHLCYTRLQQATLFQYRVINLLPISWLSWNLLALFQETVAFLKPPNISWLINFCWTFFFIVFYASCDSFKCYYLQQEDWVHFSMKANFFFASHNFPEYFFITHNKKASIQSNFHFPGVHSAHIFTIYIYFMRHLPADAGWVHYFLLHPLVIILNMLLLLKSSTDTALQLVLPCSLSSSLKLNGISIWGRPPPNPQWTMDRR